MNQLKEAVKSRRVQSGKEEGYKGGAETGPAGMDDGPKIKTVKIKVLWKGKGMEYQRENIVYDNVERGRM